MKWTNVPGWDQVAEDSGVDVDYGFDLYEPDGRGRARWELKRYERTDAHTWHLEVVATGKTRRPQGARWISVGGPGTNEALARDADEQRLAIVAKIKAAL